MTVVSPVVTHLSPVLFSLREEERTGLTRPQTDAAQLIQSQSPSSPHVGGQALSRIRKILLLLLAILPLVPPLLAIWLTPWFVTQDGPAHAYNAQVIAWNADPASPFRDVYQVQWEPLPNWTGHLALAGLVRILPVRWADHLMTSLTLAGFALSILWLRWRVAGWQGLPFAGLFAALLALNVSWLLGFNSFMLGACLFPVTLGYWWNHRDRLGPRHVLALWGLIILGYFSHLVSLGLTVIGLGVLSLFASGPKRWVRIGWTALGMLPLLPLAWIYIGLTRRGGAMQPTWKHLPNPLSLSSWWHQATWVDPITLAIKSALPFRASTASAFFLLSPVFAFLVFLLLEASATRKARRVDDPARCHSERAGWGVLAALLLVGGFICPDTLGESHGNYLPQRVVLLGLVALVPVLDFGVRSWLGRLAALALFWALTIQSAFVWEYAMTSSRQVGAVLAAKSAIGQNQRVATLLVGIPTRFRANPMVHADNLLGVDTGNVIWNNYETSHYYFPVQFKPTLDRPLPSVLEALALDNDPNGSARRASIWERELEAHHQAIDSILVWGKDDDLDQITSRWFQSVFDRDNVRVFKRQ